jgi:hypothetical protein
VDGCLTFYHSPFNVALGVGSGMPANEIDIFYNDAVPLRKDPKHLPRFSPVFPCRDKDLIIFLNV